MVWYPDDIQTISQLYGSGPFEYCTCSVLGSTVKLSNALSIKLSYKNQALKINITYRQTLNP